MRVNHSLKRVTGINSWLRNSWQKNAPAPEDPESKAKSIYRAKRHSPSTMMILNATSRIFEASNNCQSHWFQDAWKGCKRPGVTMDSARAAAGVEGLPGGVFFP